MLLLFHDIGMPPLWFILAVLIMWPVSIFLVLRGIYLLVASKTSSKTRIVATAPVALVPIASLVYFAVAFYDEGLGKVVLYLSLPFGSFVGFPLMVLVEFSYKLLPVVILVNIFLNYAGFVALVEFFMKRFVRDLK